MEPFVPVYRRLLDPGHALRGGEPVCRPFAWVDILGRTAYRNGKVRIEITGEDVYLRRGEVILGTRTLAKAWGWTRPKVQRFLRDLATKHEKLEDLGRETPIGKVYRVVTYSEWSLSGGVENPVENPGPETARDPESDPRIAIPPSDPPPNTSQAEEAHEVTNRAGGGTDPPLRSPPSDPESDPRPRSTTPTSEGRALDGTGLREDALEAVRSLAGFGPLQEKGVLGQYGRGGTQERLWRDVPHDRRPDVFSTALLRVCEIESGRWNSRFFQSVLRRAIEEELSPDPTDQAKAKSRETPAGRFTAEKEVEREAARRRRVRVGEGEVTTIGGDEASPERLDQARRWVKANPKDAKTLREEARRFFETSLGRVPHENVLEGWVLQKVSELIRGGKT